MEKNKRQKDLKEVWNNYSIFAPLVRKKSAVEFKKEEERKGKSLTKNERKLIRRKVLSRARFSTAIIGVGATAFLMGGKLNQAYIDEGKYNEPEYILEQYKVNINEYNIKEMQELQQQSKKLQENIKQEVDSRIDSADEIDLYTKQIFIEEYNEKNGTNYTADQIYVDKSKNSRLKKENVGDQIIYRIASKDEEVGSNYSPYNSGLLTVSGPDGVIERGIIINDEYYHVYNEKENIENLESPLSTGPILSNGYDLAVAINHKDENSLGTMETYKNRLIYTIKKYKEDKINTIVNSKITEEDENEIE